MTIVSNVKREDREQEKIFAEIFKTFRMKPHMKLRNKKSRMTDESESINSQYSTDRGSESEKLKQDSIFHIESMNNLD